MPCSARFSWACGSRNYRSCCSSRSPGLLQNRRTVGRRRAERAAALQRLLELQRLAKVLPRVRVIHPEMEGAGRAERIPRVDAERTAIIPAACFDFRLAAYIADHAPCLRTGAIAEGHRDDPNRVHTRPG